MAKNIIYTVGGTIKIDGGIYITRNADFELLELCRKGDFVYILSPRQVGKSSLIVRTAKELATQGFHTVIIDLNNLGVKLSRDEWYLGLLTEMKRGLNLKNDVVEWWDKYSRLGATQRLSYFLSEVVLHEIDSRIVIFVDEIDSTLSTPFADDFFAAIRSVYNSRAMNHDLQRLAFVLIGVATPSDLISDPKRTPFNVGRRVDLTDFTFNEALPLAAGLDKSPSHSEEVLKWVFEWTNGHPYLTQKLCFELSKKNQQIKQEDVVSVVDHTFLGDNGEKDGNLQFVRDMLTKRAKNPREVMRIYREVISGERIPDDEKSIDISHLKLSGVVRVWQGLLRVSNKVYQTVFDIKWVEERLTLLSELFKFLVLAAASFLFIGIFVVVLRSFSIGLLLFWGIAGLMNQKERDSLIERLELLATKPPMFQKDNDFVVPLYPRSLFDTVSKSVSFFFSQLKMGEKRYYDWIALQYEKQKKIGETWHSQLVYLMQFLLFVSVIQGGIVSVAYSFSTFWFSDFQPNQVSLLMGLVAVCAFGGYKVLQLFNFSKNRTSAPGVSVALSFVSLYLFISSFLAIAVILFGASNQLVDFLSAIFAPVNMLIALTLFRQIEIFKGIRASGLVLSWVLYGIIFLVIRISQVLGISVVVLFDIQYRFFLFCFFTVFYYVITPIDTLLSIRVPSRVK